MIQSLGTGLRTLGENTAKMSDLSSASVATDDYVKNVQNASNLLVASQVLMKKQLLQ
ncbi:MAG: hypothetical protein IPG39_24315 [Bacteroidetes bacterium]|nr:hypothetical protein [Bacteroidota bacterium]